MKYSNQDPPQKVHKPWSEHQYARDARLLALFWDSHTEVEYDEPIPGKYVIRDGKVVPKTQRKVVIIKTGDTIYSDDEAVKIQRVNPNREAERRDRRIAKKSASPDERQSRLSRKALRRKLAAHKKYGSSRAYRLLGLQAA